ncbi:hypothetical protein ABPG75_005290 [Micractinium tetrahymenae]
MAGVAVGSLSDALRAVEQAGEDCPVHGSNKPVLEPAPAAGASNVHVLLVDDERLTRTVVANLLHKCGYRVTSASDGMEALQLLRSSAPDTFQLVLTDVCMPELNGLQLLSCVKQDANLRAVPVVMMSSVDQEEAVAAAVQNGAEEYLVKPVTKKEVQHIWQHVWRRRCAAATVPQLPQEAAAAMAAAAAAAVAQQQAQQQAQQAAAAAAAPQPPAQDVQQPASASIQQAAAQQAQQAALPGGASVEALLRSPGQPTAAALQQRQAIFSAAISMVQAAHLQQRALLCLRPSRLLHSPQRGLSVAPAAAASSEVDKLYASPEEAAGCPDCRSDMFSLGLLFLDLFFPSSSQEQRCAQLRAARAAVLPAVLAGTHSASSTQAVQDLLQGLLQADPARRPTVHGVLRAGILADAYRIVAGLPHWRLLSAAAPAASAAAGVPSSSAAPAPAPAPRPPAAAASAPAAAGPAPGVDHEAVRHFLLLLRKSKQQELAQAQAQLVALEVDIGDVVSRRRVRGGSDGEPSSKRVRMEVDGEAYEPAAVIVQPSELAEEAAEAAAALPEEQAARVAAAMPQLEELFFQRRQAQLAAQQGQQAAQPPAPVKAAAPPAAAAAVALAEGSRPVTPGHLESFARDLNELAAFTRLGLKATLRSGDLASPVEMACCAAFDRDDEFFATVGVSRRVKIFDFKACLEEGSEGMMHYPALQITTRSKLSSVSWNSYVKSQLITSDYSGLIQLWDASTAGEAAQFDEHARRVWSVDFSAADPMKFLSGSDDGSVRLWSVSDPSSVARIAAPANVCSVQFSPSDCHTIAFGCANYRVYLYDLRTTAHPLAVISGPQRAVSYVKFLGGSHLVSASTDSTLRLWDLREVLTSAGGAAPCVSTASGGSTLSGGAAAGGGRVRPACTYTGHRNQRNFVGLSVSPDGHILCGSEDNSVYAYYRTLPFSIARYRFGAADGPSAEGHQPFVSAVCWANRSRHCLAANSQGLLQVLKLE